jgi:hypothetical protein
MGVDVYWKNARHEELDRALDLADHLARTILQVQSQQPPKYPVLASIDVYAERVFVPPQTDTLAAELERARAEVDDLETRIHLGRVITLAHAAASVTGSYLECVGD